MGLQISRLCALIIQTHPDNDDDDGRREDWISCDPVGPDASGKYASWITFWKGRRPHIAPLISSGYHYDTPEAATAAARATVAEIRGIDAINS